MLIYLAHPIDQAGTPNPSYTIGGARAQITHELTMLGHAVYDPQSAFRMSQLATPTAALQRVNHAAIDTADAVVALIWEGVPSVGTPAEVQYALDRGKPVVIVTDLALTSWALAGWDQPHCALIDAVLDDGPDRRLPGHQDLQAMLNLATQAAKAVPGPLASSLRFTVEGNGALPTKAFDDDAGFDLYVSESVSIEPGSFVDVPCDVKVQLPANHWGMITGRSSTLRQRGLLVNQGIIDAGYRGPLYAGCWNLNPLSRKVTAGERIAQLILVPMPAVNYRPVVVDELDPHPRGSNGFGSSGA